VQLIIQNLRFLNSNLVAYIKYANNDEEAAEIVKSYSLLLTVLFPYGNEGNGSNNRIDSNICSIYNIVSADDSKKEALKKIELSSIKRHTASNEKNTKLLLCCL